MRELAKDRSVLIVGHADGDGHLATEQSRRNAMRFGARNCSTYVDPRITAGHRMWVRYLEDIELADAETVFFVDIMFDPKNASKSVAALSDLATSQSDRQFVVIDHHPAVGLPSLPSNLAIWFTSAVYTCCFGPPSPLMIVASICDRDEGPVRSFIDEEHRRRATGVSRAATDRNLAGDSLLQLLKTDSWSVLENLADEPAALHRTVRGRRVLNLPSSDALQLAHLAVG